MHPPDTDCRTQVQLWQEQPQGQMVPRQDGWPICRYNHSNAHISPFSPDPPLRELRHSLVTGAITQTPMILLFRPILLSRIYCHSLFAGEITRMPMKSPLSTAPHLQELLPFSLCRYNHSNTHGFSFLTCSPSSGLLPFSLCRCNHSNAHGFSLLTASSSSAVMSAFCIHDTDMHVNNDRAASMTQTCMLTTAKQTRLPVNYATR